MQLLQNGVFRDERSVCLQPVHGLPKATDLVLQLPEMAQRIFRECQPLRGGRPHQRLQLACCGGDERFGMGEVPVRILE